MIFSESLKQEFINQEFNKDACFVFFDFDGTLTAKDSFMPFLKFCVGSWQYYFKLIIILPILVAYSLRLLANDKAKAIVLKWFLGGWNKDKLNSLAIQFVNQEIPKFLLDVGMQKLHYHQKQGHYCILVSASPELYLVEWAKSQGFDSILGTQLEFIDNKLTGEITGKNCFGDEKVVRINAEFGEKCWSNSVVYSDSKVDMPMLKRASKGYILENNVFVPIS